MVWDTMHGHGYLQVSFRWKGQFDSTYTWKYDGLMNTLYSSFVDIMKNCVRSIKNMFVV